MSYILETLHVTYYAVFYVLVLVARTHIPHFGRPKRAFFFFFFF